MERHSKFSNEVEFEIFKLQPASVEFRKSNEVKVGDDDNDGLILCSTLVKLLSVMEMLFILVVGRRSNVVVVRDILGSSSVEPVCNERNVDVPSLGRVDAFACDLVITGMMKGVEITCISPKLKPNGRVMIIIHCRSRM